VYTYVAGPSGASNGQVRLDGGSLGYLDRPSLTSAPNSKLTEAAWIKTPKANTVIASLNRTESAVTNSFQLSITSGGSLAFSDWGSGAGFNATSTAVVADDQWHHVAFVKDGLNGLFFVDGQPAGAATAAPAAAVVAVAAAVGVGDELVDAGADVGIAHDGDADRCLAVDAQGNIVDGDQIMAILAVAMKERGELKDNTLVTTVMSNLGLHRSMAEHGISVVTTAVGDRYVLEALDRDGFSLGGEQSGHVIMTKFATTGDGLLTGLHLVAEMARTGKTIAELARTMTVFPQVLVNVRGVNHRGLDSSDGVAAAIAIVESELGDSGRVLLRPSGTEPMVRVMVEAESQEIADAHAHALAEVVRVELSL
jgi:phosphoglucomutase